MSREGGREDVFELLLPHAGEAERREARTLSTFLRLLHDDARGPSAEVVGVELANVRAMLDEVALRELVDALEDLAGRYLAAVRDADDFLELPPPTGTLAQSWMVVLRAAEGVRREARGTIPGLPAPGERPEATFARLVDALEDWGADVEPWRRAWIFVSEGPRAVEEGLQRDLAERPLASDDPGRIRRLADLACARLQRGRVREALHGLLKEALDSVAVSPRLARLSTWALVGLGRVEEARSLAPGFTAPAERLPARLAELAARAPELAPLLGAVRLPGDAPPAADPVRQIRTASPASRSELGLSALLWIDDGPAHTPRLVAAEVAPALREAVPVWCATRDGAAGRIGTPEQRVLSRGEIVHERLEGAARTALDPERALARAFVPRRDPEGRVRGWLVVEAAHQFLPSRARLLDLAQSVPVGPERCPGPDPSVETRVSEIPARSTNASRVRVAEPVDALREPASADPVALQDAALHDAALRSEVERLVGGLALRLGRRRWSWFDATAARTGAAERDLRLLCGGGTEALPSTSDWSAESALHALRTAVPLVEPEREGVDGVRSGIALPLVRSGRVVAVFVLESTRGRDLGERDAARLARLLEGLSDAWCGARFAAWHRAHFGSDVAIDLRTRAWRRWLADLSTVRRVRTPLAVLGPAGSGKQVLARWLHYERVRGRPRWIPWRSLAHSAAARAEVDFDPATCLVFERLDRIAEDQAAEAEAVLERALRAGAQVLGLARELDGRAGSATSALQERFGRLGVAVPPLRDRRDELFGLVRTLVDRAADAEALARPRLADEALALLWRQEWPGNVRALEALLYRVVLEAAREGAGSERIGADTIRTAGRELGLVLRRRLPSRHPRRRDLEAALEGTRNKSGGLNKTRAAQLLGWDPDTLVRRMDDLGIEG